MKWQMNWFYCTAFALQNEHLHLNINIKSLSDAELNNSTRAADLNLFLAVSLSGSPCCSDLWLPLSTPGQANPIQQRSTCLYSARTHSTSKPHKERTIREINKCSLSCLRSFPRLSGVCVHVWGRVLKRIRVSMWVICPSSRTVALCHTGWWSGVQGELCACHYHCDDWNQLKGGVASHSHSYISF